MTTLTRTRNSALQSVYESQRNDHALKALRGDRAFEAPTGPLNPDILFLGRLGCLSAPLMAKWCKAARLDYSRCFFSDVFKHSLVGGRRPSELEYDVALGYVEDEIAVLRPRVVVPIGVESLAAFIKIPCIQNERGQMYDWGSFVLTPLVYPATAHLYDDAKYVEANYIADLRKIERYSRRLKK